MKEIQKKSIFMRCCIHIQYIYKIRLIPKTFFLDFLGSNHFFFEQFLKTHNYLTIHVPICATSRLRLEFVYLLQHDRSCCTYTVVLILVQVRLEFVFV